MEASAMKMTKAMAVIAALVMFAICFNTSAVFSGDEHPWDQDGAGGHPGSNGGRDTTIIGGGSTSSVRPTISGNLIRSKLTGLDNLLFAVRFITWYRDIPSVHLTNARGVVVKSGGNHATNAK